MQQGDQELHLIYQPISVKEGIKVGQGMAMNKDESILVNGFYNDIQLWDYNKGNGSLNLIQTLKGHDSNVYCLCFSKKSHWFVSGSRDMNLCIWKEENNGEWHKLQFLEGHSDDVYKVVLNDEEDQLISCSFDKTMKLWMRNDDSQQWEIRQTLTDHTASIENLCFNPLCDTLASCGYDNLRIWKKQIGFAWKQRQIIDPPKDDIFVNACFISANELIAVTEKQNKFYRLSVNQQGLYQISFELLLNKSQPSPPRIYFPLIYNKKKRLVIAGYYENIYILSQQGNGEFQIDQVLKGHYVAGNLLDDGQQLILGNYGDNKIEIWEIKNK